MLPQVRAEYCWTQVRLELDFKTAQLVFFSITRIPASEVPSIDCMMLFDDVTRMSIALLMSIATCRLLSMPRSLLAAYEAKRRVGAAIANGTNPKILSAESERSRLQRVVATPRLVA